MSYESKKYPRVREEEEDVFILEPDEVMIWDRLMLNAPYGKFRYVSEAAAWVDEIILERRKRLPMKSPYPNNRF